MVAMFEAVVACLSVFTGLSIHGAVGVRYYDGERDTFPQYVAVCLLILFGSTLITAAVVSAAESPLGRFTGLSNAWLFIAVLVSSAQFLVNIRLVIWQSGNQALRYGIFQIAQTALNASISLYLVLYLTWGSEGRMAGYALATIIFGLIALLSMQTSGWMKWKWSREYFDDAMQFGLPLIPHTLGALAVAFSDRFIITESLGVDATGLYFAAVQLSMPLLMLGSSFNRAFVPWLFSKLANNENALAVTASYIAIFGLLLSGVFYSLFVHFALSLIVGEQYHQAKGLALILIIGTSFQAAYYAVVNYIFYAKRTGSLSVITLFTGAGYVLGAWIVVPSYGLQGVSMLFATIQCLTFILVWLVSSRVSPQPWVDFALLRRTFRKTAE